MLSGAALAIVVMFSQGQYALADAELSQYRADRTAARYHVQLHTQLDWPLDNCPARPIWELAEGELPEFQRNFLSWIKKGQVSGPE